jgi:hypothetical protein
LLKKEFLAALENGAIERSDQGGATTDHSSGADRQTAHRIMQAATTVSGCVSGAVPAIVGIILGKGVDELTRPLSAIAIVGPVFAGLTLAVRCGALIYKAHENVPKIHELHKRVTRIGEQLCKIVVGIVKLGVPNKTFVDDLFAALGDSWGVLVRIERHALSGLVKRGWQAQIVDEYVTDVSRLEAKLFDARLLEYCQEVDLKIGQVKEAVDARVDDIDKRLGELESSVTKKADGYRPVFQEIPPPKQISSGARHYVEQLVEAVLSRNTLSVSAV